MTYGPPAEPPPGQPGGGYQPPGQPGQYQPPPGQYGPPPNQPYPGPPPGQQQYGPPQGQPPGQPPGQQQYGPPQGGYGYGPPRPAFRMPHVDPLDWALIAAALVVFIFSFFDYFGVSAKSEIQQLCRNNGASCSSTQYESAWHEFLSWAGVLLLVFAGIATAVAAFAPHIRMPNRMITLVLAALGLIFTFIALFVVPEGDAPDPFTDQNGNPVARDKVYDFPHGFSYWIILIVSVAAVVLAVVRYQQTGGNLAALFPRRTPPGGYGYGQPGYYQQPPPQQGYQQQPQGYQQAPPQQQGYQQPTPAYQPPPQQPGYQPQSPEPTPAPPPPAAPASDRPEPQGQPHRDPIWDQPTVAPPEYRPPGQPGNQPPPQKG